MKDSNNSLINWSIISLLLIGFIIFILLFQGNHKNKKKFSSFVSNYKKIVNAYTPKVTKATNLHREPSIRDQFNRDGSHIKLTRAIKKNMSDPSSYEHVNTNYVNRDDHIVVITEYKSKSSNGEMTTKIQKARVDINGNILKVY